MAPCNLVFWGSLRGISGVYTGYFFFFLGGGGGYLRGISGVHTGYFGGCLCGVFSQVKGCTRVPQLLGRLGGSINNLTLVA